MTDIAKIVFQNTNTPFRGKEVIVVQFPSPPPKPIMESYQTVIVGLLAFVIGILTVSNAIFSTYINDRNRKKDDLAKRTAFFSVILSDIDQNIENIQKISEILSAIDLSNCGSPMWINNIRVASRSNLESPLNSDWEKFSILSPDEIRSLRRLQNRYLEISGLFSSILDDPNPARAQGALPLFEPRITDADQENELDRLSILFEDLVDSVNEGLTESNEIRTTLSLLIGE